MREIPMTDIETSADRAREFCEGAFGPFGVNIEPYVKTITELLEYEADKARLRISKVLQEAAKIEADKGPDADGEKIYWMRQFSDVLSVSRDDLVEIALVQMVDEIRAEQGLTK